MKRSTMKWMLSVVLTLMFVFQTFSAAAADILPKEGMSLAGYTIILHTNDSHGRAVPASGGMLGFTAVRALKKDYEAAGAQVILLDAGDTLHGLPIANMYQGRSIVNLMNIIGYDAMVPGNHDFNYGTDVLKKLTGEMKFKLLSANISKKDNKEKLFDSNMIIEKNGVKYGIFGLSTPETAYMTNPKNVADINFDDPVETAKKQVADLKEKGATFIIALTHLGLSKSSKYTSDLLARKVAGINLIVDGHSHTVLKEGQMEVNTMIVSTGSYIQNIGVVEIAPNGHMLARLVNGDTYKKTDKDLDEVVSRYSSQQDSLLSQVVGSTKVELDGVREHVRAGETNLGNLSADAVRDVAKADIALLNGGGIRASIDVGDITKKEVVTVFPFGNYVVTEKITGEALIKALEQGASAYPEPLGAFLQVSGITYTLNAANPAGSRISNVKVNGKKLDPKAEYLLATNDFMAAGGDGYTMLADFKVVAEYGSLEDVFMDYLHKNGEINVQNENRITIVNIKKTDKE